MVVVQLHAVRDAGGVQHAPGVQHSGGGRVGHPGGQRAERPDFHGVLPGGVLGSHEARHLVLVWVRYCGPGSVPVITVGRSAQVRSPV